jgi:hypothetical protein
MSGLDVAQLTPKQEEAIAALLNCPSIKKAADQVGMSERQLYRWLDEPGFSKAYRAARRQAFSHAISLTQQYAPAAVATLTKISTDPSAPHAARVSPSAIACSHSSRPRSAPSEAPRRTRGTSHGGRGRGRGHSSRNEKVSPCDPRATARP